MFSCKYVFLFPVLISSPVHWWCSVLFPSVLCAVHHVVTVNTINEWRKKPNVCVGAEHVRAEPWMHVMVLWSCCSQEVGSRHS